MKVINTLTGTRYMLSDIQRLQDKLKPNKTNEGDRKYLEI